MQVLFPALIFARKIQALKKLLPLIFIFFSINSFSQDPEDRLGAWYMYFWNHDFKESRFGIQGDFQYRDHQILGDFQQFIARAGLSYAPNANIRFVGGYSHFTSGTLGESRETSTENRIFEDINLNHSISQRFRVNHRFRFEQRWVVNQDFRSRYRYLIGLNVPLGGLDATSKFYLSFFNEVFINGEREIGDGRRVQYFDRNWLAGSLGYVISEKLRVQLGIMRETTNSGGKNQLLVSLHQTL